MTDPITREQVERLIVANREAAAGRGSLTPMSDVLGPAWRDVCPAYVVDLCHGGTTVHMWPDFIATLTRWRDELAAAEPVRRVPSCGMCGEPFGPALSRAHGSESGMCTECWGGAPAEDSPERLRERREALGLERNSRIFSDVAIYEGNIEHVEECPGFNAVGVRLDCCPITRARYAAALSAAEAERAAVHVALNGDVTVDVRSLPPGVLRVEHRGPPAPEVVDVPQSLPKTVAHFYTIRALPENHRVSWNMPGDGPQWVRINESLWLHVDDLRAMLADIDAQQPATLGDA